MTDLDRRHYILRMLDVHPLDFDERRYDRIVERLFHLSDDLLSVEVGRLLTALCGRDL